MAQVMLTKAHILSLMLLLLRRTTGWSTASPVALSQNPTHPIDPQAQPSTKTSTQEQRLAEAAEPAPADAEPRAEQAAKMAAKPPPPEVQLAGPEPKRFSVGKGQLKDVLTASWASLFRVGSGVFNMGYSGEGAAPIGSTQFASQCYDSCRLTKPAVLADSTPCAMLLCSELGEGPA
jgi:hypothetical protein